MIVCEPTDVVARANAHALNLPVFESASLARLGAERLGEPWTISPGAIAQNVINPREQVDVDVDVIE